MSKKKKAVQQDTTPYKNYLNYLGNYDTSNADTVLNNLTDWAANSSANNLNNMGDYTFSVNGSDEARQRMEDALYNSAVDKLTPQFERQTSNYATMLQNQGIPVGSEAYNRAMGELEEKQNDSLRQAAYQSIINGQDAFSQSLNDEVNAGSYGINAQQAYIRQLLGALDGSPSEYENQQNVYAAGTAKSAADFQNAKAKAAAKGGGLGGFGSLLGAVGGAAIGGLVSGGTGAGVGAKIGSSIGGALG